MASRAHAQEAPAPAPAAPAQATPASPSPAAPAPAGAPPAPAEAPSVATLRLEELVKRALERSPTVEVSQHKIRAAQAQLDEAKVSPFTQFSITAGLAPVPETRGTASYSDASNQLGVEKGGKWTVGWAADIGGTVPLYTWGKIRSAWTAAEQGVEASHSERARVETQVRFEVRRAYFALQFALDVLALLDESKGKLESAVKKLEQRIEDGDPDVDETDRYRLSSTLAEMVGREAEAIRLERSSRGALAILIGESDVQVPECPSEAVGYELETTPDYQKRARNSRAELRMLDNAVRGKKAAVTVASSQYYPAFGIDLRASRTYTPGRTNQTNPWVVDNANGGGFGAALGAKWNLDFYGTHKRVERAEAELDQTRAQKKAASMGIEIEITTLVEAVRESQAQEAAWATGERDTRAWFLSAVQSYQVGTNESRDLVDAVRAYLGARAKHLDSIRALNTALADLERATGDTLIVSKAWEGTCAP